MAATTALRRIGAGVVVVALVAAVVVVVSSLRHKNQPAPSCSVSTGTGTAATTYTLAVDQAANSTTIAAVAKRLGLPDHAVTIALATSLQESRLRNLSYGDRDSLGLFQQRPSQGWGTASEILTPSYAAAAFYRELVKVTDWATLPLTVAAQKVQRSGAPSAYAQWEPEARALAIATTGEKGAGLTCRFSLARSASAAPAFAASLSNELGVSSLDGTFTAPQGWTVTAWLVAHAEQYRVTTIAFRGQEWRAATGRWRPTPPTDDHIRYAQQPPAT
jgi:hypothetical protein